MNIFRRKTLNCIRQWVDQAAGVFASSCVLARPAPCYEISSLDVGSCGTACPICVKELRDTMGCQGRASTRRSILAGSAGDEITGVPVCKGWRHPACIAIDDLDVRTRDPFCQEHMQWQRGGTLKHRSSATHPLSRHEPALGPQDKKGATHGPNGQASLSKSRIRGGSGRRHRAATGGPLARPDAGLGREPRARSGDLLEELSWTCSATEPSSSTSRMSRSGPRIPSRIRAWADGRLDLEFPDTTGPYLGGFWQPALSHTATSPEADTAMTRPAADTATPTASSMGSLVSRQLCPASSQR